MADLNARQITLVRQYIKQHPHIAELLDRAINGGDGDRLTLGNAIAELPYPPSIDGTDAHELSRIGLRDD